MILGSLFTFVLATNAAPTPPSKPGASTEKRSSRWSNEAIIALAAIFVAISGVLITIIASPKIWRTARRKYLFNL
jgi:hypothetical protein